MKTEDKELLLKDLSARLPYHCRVFYEYVDDLDNKTYGYSLTLNTWCIDEFVANKAVIKPYLRPISSMTEEEFVYFMNLRGKMLQSYEIKNIMKKAFNTTQSCGIVTQLDKYSNKIDWLIANHFDHRGLIPMGLALEAPKDMYKL